MKEARERGPSIWIIAPFVAITLWRMAYYLRKAIPAWNTWQTGGSDAYPHEHEFLFWTALAGFVSIACLPLPLFMARVERRGRWAFVAVWVILMCESFALEHRASAVSP